jgi:hypothetical protein
MLYHANKNSPLPDSEWSGLFLADQRPTHVKGIVMHQIGETLGRLKLKIREVRDSAPISAALFPLQYPQ